MKAQTLLEQVRAARQKSVPLISIGCPDPAATIRSIVAFYDDATQTTKKAPLIQWDCVRGLVGLNEAGVKAVGKLLVPADAAADAEPEDPSVSLNLTDMLHRAARVGKAGSIPGRLPERTILFVMNAQRHIGGDNPPGLIQAIWNARDPFKANFRTLILLSPDFVPPRELADDILPLEEPLPNPDELKAIVEGQYKAAAAAFKELPKLDDETREKAVDALRGLSSFPSEQVVSLALKPTGLDLNLVWERKRRMVELTPGLSVWRGGETFADIGGMDNLKQFLRKTLDGKAPPRAIVFIDEIEKALAGAVGIGDSSGVSQAMLGTLLSFMEDTKSTGIILIGPPGVSKSVMAKAAGTEGGIPTIAFDLSGMKDSLVGSSEANERRALRVVRAVSDGAAMFIATCNEIALLPPPLRRRFTFGTYFCDLPDNHERPIIWNMYCERKGIALTSERPADEGWTGAEIKQCVDIAWRLDISLKEASKYVTPVAIAAKEQVERLRKSASNRFISASKPGFYVYKPIKSIDDIETIPFEGTARGMEVN